MRKIVLGMGILILGLLMAGFAFSEEQVSVSAGKPLAFTQYAGADDVELEPTLYPDFYSDNSENPDCALTNAAGGCGGKDGYYCNQVYKDSGELMSRWTATTVTAGKWGKNKDPYKKSGCSAGKRKCDSSGICTNVYFPCKQGAENNEDLAEGEYQEVPSLTGNISSVKGYEKISKMFFTWTVRVEGRNRTLEVWPFICHPHHGTSSQKFLTGQLKTRLFIMSKEKDNGVHNADSGDSKSFYYNSGQEYSDPEEYVPVGLIAEITVPKSGSGAISNPGDPTISGSYLLSRDDFQAKKLPAEIYFEVRWYNESSMKIKSPKNQRNIVVTAIPVTEIKEED